MKVNNKEKSKSKKNLQPKKANNDNVKNNNPFFIPIKYFCFNEVKKIVDNKNKKSPGINKNNEKLKKQIKNEKIRKEEEDDYTKIIYNKPIIIPHNISLTNLIRKKYAIYKIEANNKYLNYCKSTDERYKSINKLGLNTKKIINIYKERKSNLKNNNIKKSKFSKKDRLKKKNKNKTKNNIHNYIDIHDINNININNLIYRGNNINYSESNNNTLTSNTITSKTITNNTMSNYTISNVTPNSYYNKQNNTNTNNNTNSNATQNLSNQNEKRERGKSNKINNIKVITNKGRNKNKNNNINRIIRNKNVNNNEKEKENTVFVRRIILEEKFTIDSKGDKKTIYIKKISPAMKTNDIINSADKRLIKNKKIIKNNNYNNKDNTYINHNDINLNFNVCSFQKINLNNNLNQKNSKKEKTESFDEDYYKYNNNINTSLNDNILQNYKDFLNIKNCNKIIYQKPNSIIYNSEKNHKSFQSVFSSPNKRYFIKLMGNDLNKKRQKISQKKINNSSKNNEIIIKKKSTRDFKLSNTPLKYMLSHPRCLKNKVVHRKTKTNLNNIEYEKVISFSPEEYEENNKVINKRSFSFVGKNTVYNLVKKLKNNKKSELKEKLKNGNNTHITHLTSKNPAKINEYFHFSPLISSINTKSNTKMNSFNNSQYTKNNEKNKSNLYFKTNESHENNSRCHSLNKITTKINYNSNEMKEILNYLKNNMIASSGRNKSHRNFLLKKCEKFNLDDVLINKNKKNNSNNKKGNHSNFIHMKYKIKEKL